MNSKNAANLDSAAPAKQIIPYKNIPYNRFREIVANVVQNRFGVRRNSDAADPEFACRRLKESQCILVINSGLKTLSERLAWAMRPAAIILCEHYKAKANANEKIEKQQQN